MTSALVRGGLQRRRRRVRVLGLTGSIGMGKSTAAAMACRLGYPVHDADRTVHRLLAPGGPAVDVVVGTFGNVLTRSGGIDRRRLGDIVFSDPAALKRLEAILHPLVAAAERRFIYAAAVARRSPVILDIPLLFETGGESRCDLVAVVTAPLFLRAQRILSRGGITADRLARIVSKQTSEPFKRLNADIVIGTGLGYRPALRALKRALSQTRRGPLRPFGRKRYRAHA